MTKRMTPQQFRKILKREEKNRPDFYQGIYGFTWNAAFIDRCPSARDFLAFVRENRRVCARNDCALVVLARFAFARFCALEIDEWELAEAMEYSILREGLGVLDSLQAGYILTGRLNYPAPSSILRAIPRRRPSDEDSDSFGKIFFGGVGEKEGRGEGRGEGGTCVLGLSLAILKDLYAPL